MKTLDELVKELGLKPTKQELEDGRVGNFVVILDGNFYVTMTERVFWVESNFQVIEVKPDITDKLITSEEAKTLLYGMALNPTSLQYEQLLKYITQQEQFAKDVVRYFKLNYKQYNEGIQNEECDEYMTLEEKLTKGVAK